ncbi:MAG: CARDB domain-containing protein [bacterium]|nr:CARDB domain-containing protein [bacterium]
MVVTTKGQQRKKLLLNILAIVGLVILISIVILGLYRIATLSKSWFSSFFSRNANSIQITVSPTKVASGESATILWKYSAKEAGAYGFLYQCDKNLVLKTPGAVSDVLNAIPCGASYKIPSTKTSLSLIPTLSGTSSASIPISIIFVPSATSGTRAQGNATLQIVSKKSTAVTFPAPSTNTTSPVPSNPPQAEPYAPKAVDLSVYILSVGVIEPISGNIIPRKPTSPNDLVAVRFTVANHGNTSSGPWYFTAQLPTTSAYTYTSPVQASLTPGSSIENMLRFTNASSEGMFTVSVDPSNQVNESNEDDNFASVRI